MIGKKLNSTNSTFANLDGFTTFPPRSLAPSLRRHTGRSDGQRWLNINVEAMIVAH